MISIGSKVVGVGSKEAAEPIHESHGGNFTFPQGLPERGSVYVVIGFFAHDDILGLKLIGFPVFHKTIGEVGWDSRCFRELEEMKSRASEEKSEQL